MDITDWQCVISVVDVAGDHFSHAEVGLEPADLDADGGRGIHLVRSLVDELRFTMDGERGLLVQFIKHLTKVRATRSAMAITRHRLESLSARASCEWEPWKGPENRARRTKVGMTAPRSGLSVAPAAAAR